MQKKSVFKKRLKQLGVGLCVLVLITAAAACDEKAPEYAMQEAELSGGTQMEQQPISISDIDINYFEGKSEIALHFVYSGLDETQGESTLISLPQYEISVLDEPYRLVIKLHAVDDVKYVQKSAWGLGEQISGLFRAKVKDTDVTTLYFELTGPVKFLADEGDSTLRVLLESKKTQPSESHFVMVNAFDAYLNGEIGDAAGLLPVLCADNVNIGLISKPYPSEEAAESARSALEAELTAKGILRTPYTLTLAGETQPIMNTDIDGIDASQKHVALMGRKAETLPVMFEDGRLIGEGSSAVFYAKQSSIGDETGESLWWAINGDASKDMGLPIFSSVQQFAFASSERYFGFIDVNVDTSVLYVYDTLSGWLFNMGEEGFGINTASFAWAENENALYAVTGDEKKRIAKCSFGEEALTLSVVVGDVTGQGKLMDMGDMLLLADNAAGEHGIIYGFDKRTGEKTFLTEGVDFAMAPDKATMAVFEYLDYGEEVGYGNLKIYSFLDRSETMVAQGSVVQSFAYLPSSTAFIYTDGTKSDETYGFNNALLTYDMGTSTATTLGYLTSGRFVLLNDAKRLALMDDYLGSDGKYHYTTYQLDWKNYQ